MERLSGFGLLATIFLLPSGVAAQAVPPPPTQPILVVQNSGSANVYQNFVAELLATEGINL